MVSEDYMTLGNLFPMINTPLGIYWLLFLSSEIVRPALIVEGAEPIRQHTSS